MSVLLQISDPHFGTERTPVVAALTELVRRQKPSLIVLSGDITQRARPREFESALRFLQSFEVERVLCIPGNHDISLFNPIARFCFPYASYTKAFGAELEPEHESASLLVLCVNTTRRYRVTDGEVSRTQVERVAKRLREASPEQLRVVVTHQPVHVIRESDRKNLLGGHERAVSVWSAAGADLILGGHIHLPYVRPLSEAFPNLPRRTWSVQAGTAVSNRLRGGTSNSVNLLHHSTREPHVCDVERWDYVDEGSAFVRVQASRLELERGVGP
jgi:3',5'-cyclic AMP phosphodiesterase CpdA